MKMFRKLVFAETTVINCGIKCLKLISNKNNKNSIFPVNKTIACECVSLFSKICNIRPKIKLIDLKLYSNSNVKKNITSLKREKFCWFFASVTSFPLNHDQWNRNIIQTYAIKSFIVCISLHKLQSIFGSSSQ